MLLMVAMANGATGVCVARAVMVAKGTEPGNATTPHLQMEGKSALEALSNMVTAMNIGVQ